MPYLETAIGIVAALSTTASYVPQLRKAWVTGQTGDLSIKMLGLLATGLALWIAYGLLREDLVIIFANAISLTLLICILAIKLKGNHLDTPEN